MKRFILLIALVGTSAGAEPRSITQIAFSGPGIITSSAGYHPPRVGSGNKIYGYIRFNESNCLPGNISGTVNLGNFSTGNSLCDNVWTVADRFKSIDVFSQFTSAFLTFDNGDLIGVHFDGTYGPNRFGIDTTSFAGEWSYYPPFDYSYRGTWELTDVRIAYDGEALPGTVPEPASWAMLVAGFGIVGAALRRQPRRKHPGKDRSAGDPAASVNTSPIV